MYDRDRAQRREQVIVVKGRQITSIKRLHDENIILKAELKKLKEQHQNMRTDC